MRRDVQLLAAVGRKRAAVAQDREHAVGIRARLIVIHARQRLERTAPAREIARRTVLVPELRQHLRTRARAELGVHAQRVLARVHQLRAERERIEAAMPELERAGDRHVVIDVDHAKWSELHAALFHSDRRD